MKYGPRNIGIVSAVTQTMSSCSNLVQSDEINTVEPDIYYHTAAFQNNNLKITFSTQQILRQNNHSQKLHHYTHIFYAQSVRYHK